MEQSLERLGVERLDLVQVHWPDPTTPVADRCTCSRDGIANVLNTFTAEDREDMLEDGEIVATCEFCSSAYRFSLADFG